MRLSSATTVLAAGLLCLAPSLPAQSSWPNAFSFVTDGQHGSRLGVGLRDIDADRANTIKLGEPRGVEVESVVDESPAEQAGIKAGDVLLSYNGETIVGAQQLGRLVSETPVGRKVKIEYWRQGKVATVTATTAALSSRVTAIPGMPDLDMRDFHMPFTEMSIPQPQMVWRTSVGIEYESLAPQLADFFGVKRGVLVRSVTKDSAASKAGVRAGDVVTQIGERSVTNPQDIGSYIRAERRANKPFSLEVMREHKTITLNIAAAAGPQE